MVFPHPVEKSCGKTDGGGVKFEIWQKYCKKATNGTEKMTILRG
jgi:hypothetical protein